MIIFDENIDQAIIDLFSISNNEVLSIRLNHPGITDIEVIQLAKRKRGLLITEDKDFGELVFSHQIKGCSVILLRYKKEETSKIVQQIKKVVAKHHKKTDHHFYTITKNKIRVKKI